MLLLQAELLWSQLACPLFVPPNMCMCLVRGIVASTSRLCISSVVYTEVEALSLKTSASGSLDAPAGLGNFKISGVKQVEPTTSY